MKTLIVNAYDFGYTSGVNDGIIKAHSEGIVTSTSLMVYGKAAKTASKLSKFPKLSVGLHFQITSKKLESDICNGRSLSLQTTEKINKEFIKQLKDFKKITGKNPTHLDSHHHIHMSPNVKSIFEKYSKKYGIPVRGFYGVKMIKDFFGWNSLRIRDLNRISVNNLLNILSRLEDGVGELMCHPGLLDKKLDGISRYSLEREDELKTLTDVKISNFIRKSGIKLANWTEAYKDML